MCSNYIDQSPQISCPAHLCRSAPDDDIASITHSALESAFLFDFPILELVSRCLKAARISGFALFHLTFCLASEKVRLHMAMCEGIMPGSEAQSKSNTIPS